MSPVAIKREQLLELIRSFGSAAVAFSAGVDSTVVANAAQLALGENAVAVTGTSASLASGELEEAESLAAQIGIRHIIISTDEFAEPRYTQNAPDRCYHCKTELYGQLDGLTERLGVNVVLNGANVDDASDYRPGMKAATEHDVRSPLAECGFTKNDVRALAEHWRLPVWDKPATPCLSSRVAYEEEVTPERLRMIDRSERLLREQGFRNVRVRYHRGDLARIEVPADEIAKLIPDEIRSQLAEQLRQFGFKFVTIDIEGFRSGSLNSLVQLTSTASPAKLP
ncbi:MAG: ATP-dependent sacrificial sulfur transferase LarE [Planctomycetes bacterium]|nr:ATP-dependent sacrificial sulfur transferase LarE [Planctomycetota bacterium]